MDPRGRAPADPSEADRGDGTACCVGVRANKWRQPKGALDRYMSGAVVITGVDERARARSRYDTSGEASSTEGGVPVAGAEPAATQIIAESR
jgi:hypothetical protein